MTQAEGSSRKNTGDWHKGFASLSNEEMVDIIERYEKGTIFKEASASQSTTLANRSEESINVAFLGPPQNGKSTTINSAKLVVDRYREYTAIVENGSGVTATTMELRPWSIGSKVTFWDTRGVNTLTISNKSMINNLMNGVRDNNIRVNSEMKPMDLAVIVLHPKLVDQDQQRKEAEEIYKYIKEELNVPVLMLVTCGSKKTQCESLLGRLNNKSNIVTVENIVSESDLQDIDKVNKFLCVILHIIRQAEFGLNRQQNHQSIFLEFVRNVTVDQSRSAFNQVIALINTYSVYIMFVLTAVLAFFVLMR